MSAALTEQVDAAHGALARARRLLCEPSAANLQLCCGILADAHRAINAVRAEAEHRRPSDRGLAASAVILHNEIRVIGVLLERAASFHANLLERMVAASSTPAPDVPTSRPARLLVEA